MSLQCVQKQDQALVGRARLALGAEGHVLQALDDGLAEVGQRQRVLLAQLLGGPVRDAPAASSAGVRNLVQTLESRPSATRLRLGAPFHACTHSSAAAFVSTKLQMMNP